MDRRSVLISGAIAIVGAAVGAFIPKILDAIGYLFKRRIERSAPRDALQTEEMQIDRLRKLTELKKVMQENGQTLESLNSSGLKSKKRMVRTVGQRVL